MSLSAGLPGYRSTDGGLKYSGFQGPVLAGKIADGGSAGLNLPTAGGVMCVQSTSSLVNQAVSTADAVIASRASFIYIPVIATTGSLAGSVPPPYLGVGTPLVWSDGAAQLIVYSSSRASWMTLIATTSMSAGGFTTSA